MAETTTTYWPAPEPTKTYQLSRRKGDRWPEGTVRVSRPSKWGNPFRIGWWFREGTLTAHEHEKPDTVLITPEVAKDAYGKWVRLSKDRRAVWIREHVHELAGATLGCWCAMGAACHRDVLAHMADFEAVVRALATHSDCSIDEARDLVQTTLNAFAVGFSDG